MDILCISQHSSWWHLHGAHERCILRGLLERGASVDYFICNGANKLCGKNVVITTPERCGTCHADSTQEADLLGLPWMPLYGDETKGMAALAEKWVSSLDKSRLVDAEFATYPLGRWMLSTVYTAFRMNEYIPGRDEAVDNYFFILLRDACLNLLRVREVFDSKEYDAVVLFNNRIMINHIIFQLARMRGISVYSHERGPIAGGVRLNRNEHISSRGAMTALESLWKDIPLSEGQLETTRAYFARRERGDTSITNWSAFSTLGSLPPELTKAFEEKLVWSVFPSSTDEIAASSWFQEATGYQDQHLWLEDLVREAAKFPNVHLVVRGHPNLMPSSHSQGSPTERKWYAELAERHRHNPNVSIIQPYEPVSSYALMNISDAGFVFLSTAGLEMAAKGVPVAIGHIPLYALAGIGLRTDSPERLEQACDTFSRLPKGWRDIEMQRKTFRFAYTSVYRWNLPMPLVLMPNPHVGHLVDFDQSRFLPGRTPDLDRIVEWIINDEEPLLRPGPEDPHTDAEQETAWLRSLSDRERAGPAYLTRRPAVSVIMSVHNGEEHVHESISSILNQTFEDFEFIVVDDASTDGTPALLESFSDPRLKLVRNEQHRERAYSHNLAIEQASTPLIAVMGADDFSMPERLEKQVALMESEPDVVWCSSVATEYESHGILRPPYESEAIRISLLSANRMAHSAWVVKKAAIQMLGGYKHDFVPAEDYHLLARASMHKGWRFHNIQEILLRYRTHPNKNRMHYLSVQMENANKVRLFLLHKLLPDVKKESLGVHLAFCGFLPVDTLSAEHLDTLRGWGDLLLQANRKKCIYEQQVFEAWVARRCSMENQEGR